MASRNSQVLNYMRTQSAQQSAQAQAESERARALAVSQSQQPKPPAPPPAPTQPATAPAPSAPGTFQNPMSLLMKQQNESAFGNVHLDTVEDAGIAGSRFGYTGQDINGDGIPDTGFQVDPNNPFSRASLLQRQYDQAKRGTTTSMAASGQLYSGALQRQQDELGFQNAQRQDANRVDYAQVLSALRRQLRDASLGRTRANTEVDYSALVAAIQGGA